MHSLSDNLPSHSRVLRAVTTQYGLWDQLRFDQTRNCEFCFSLYIHEQLRGTRSDPLSQSAPYEQSQSKEVRQYIIANRGVDCILITLAFVLARI